MGRGSTQVLIRKIMVSLTKGAKSATEIAEETGLDRTAVLRYLEVLKDSDFVIDQKEGVSKKFILSSNYRLDTYFGLPLNKEVNSQIDSIYHMIRDEWKAKTGRKLLKTTAQKIMYKVIKDCELKDIPVGWYIYGGICVKPYDYENSYDFTGLESSVSKCVKETVEEYSKCQFAYQSKQHQYTEEKNELYDMKEEILGLLYSANFSKNSMYVFQKKFGQFWRLIPQGDKLYKDLINYYDTLLIDITKEWDNFVIEKDEIAFAEFKQKLIKSFEALWKLVAMYNFKRDMQHYYLEKQLDEHFKLDLSQAKEELIQAGSEINEMIPFEEPDDPTYWKVKEALKEANKPVNEEVLKKQNDELDKIRAEKGDEAYQEELYRRVGLK